MTTLNADTSATLHAFFDFVDTDGDGYITVEEIRAACAVDVDGDGLTSESEMVACAKPWLEKFIEQDRDGDSRVSLQELLLYNTE